MQPTGYPIDLSALEKHWNAYMKMGKVDSGNGVTPDPAVLQSWARCKLRLDPLVKPHVGIAKESAFEIALKHHSELLTVAIPHIEDVYQFIEGSGCAILLTDGTACVLSIGGDKHAILMLNDMGLGYGAYWAEGQLGTNALSLVLNTAMPTQVVGAEHYFKALHHLVTSAAPIHDIHGRISSVLAIVGPVSAATSHTLSLVMATARAISNQMQANLYLEEGNRRLSEVNAMLGALNEGVLAWDSNGKINHVNPQAGKMLFLNPTSVLGKPLTETLQVPSVILEAIEQHSELSDVEISFERAEHTVNALVSLRPIFEGSATPVGYITILRAIEQVRQLVHQQVGAHATLTLNDFSTESTAMRKVLRQATIAARGRAPVILRGEGGVGKNSLGQAIHNAGGRANKPFMAINCRAIPHKLMATEFLGYDPVEGQKGRPSKFELANGGTLFVEQIDSLSLEMQSALLHVLETGHIMRLHSTRLIPVDIRIIATTTANLEQLVTEGSFVRQLYYAFGVFNLYIPPLRERPEDISFTINRFFNRVGNGKNHKLSIDTEAQAVLHQYPWPGNARELENTLERALNYTSDGVIRVIDLPEMVRQGRVINKSSPAPQPVITTANAEREAIIQAGWACHGRVTEMAKQLGIGRTTLWRKLKRFNISPNQFKN